MGASGLARIVLFLSSYSPLFVILGLRNSFGNDVVRYGMLALAILSVAFLVVFLAMARGITGTRIRVDEANSRDGEAMSYIVTYLLPFLDVSFTDAANALSLTVILLVIAVIYVHSNMIHVNPILSLMGYHVFEVRTDSGKVSSYITRSKYIRPGTEILASPVGDQVLVEKKP